MNSTRYITLTSTMMGRQPSWCRRQLRCFVLLFWLITCSASSPFNPYSILGVTEDASQDEIRSKYRKLCLKYHPDKNVQKSSAERKKCEEIFKQIQKANELVGDEERRQNYNSMQRYSSSSRSYGHSDVPSGHPNDIFDAMYQRYYQQHQQQQGGSSQKPAFYFNGVDISSAFSPEGGPTFWMPQSSLKSKYIQKVKVPLKDLYRGKHGVEILLHDHVWNRYAASFRGGCAAARLYEALAVSLGMVRIVRFPWSFLLGAIFFHFSLPKPTKLEYIVDLQAGWKTGTKLKFNGVERGFDVVFILEEESHPLYRRIGNDLYTSVTIDESQRKSGCTITLDPLDESDESIAIKLKPNQISKDHSNGPIRVEGRGWPGRKGKEAGDLFVSVKVGRRSRKTRRTTRRR